MNIFKYIGILVYIVSVVTFLYCFHNIDIVVNGEILGADTDFNGFIEIPLRDAYINAMTGFKLSLIMNIISFALLLKGDKPWSRI